MMVVLLAGTMALLKVVMKAATKALLMVDKMDVEMVDL